MDTVGIYEFSSQPKVDDTDVFKTLDGLKRLGHITNNTVFELEVVVDVARVVYNLQAIKQLYSHIENGFRRKWFTSFKEDFLDIMSESFLDYVRPFRAIGKTMVIINGSVLYLNTPFRISMDRSMSC